MVKVISLSEEAYATLKGVKDGTESFSDTVIRLTKKKGDIMDLVGIAKDDPEFIKGLKKAHQDREKISLRVF